MRSGTLRHRITLQSKSATNSGSFSEEQITWPTFATVWGSVEPLSAREFIELGRKEAEVTHRVKIRYLAGVVPTMRVLFGTRLFQVESVINWSELNEELILVCQELVKQ